MTGEENSKKEQVTRPEMQKEDAGKLTRQAAVVRQEEVAGAALVTRAEVEDAPPVRDEGLETSKEGRFKSLEEKLRSAGHNLWVAYDFGSLWLALEDHMGPNNELKNEEERKEFMAKFIRRLAEHFITLARGQKRESWDKMLEELDELVGLVKRRELIGMGLEEVIQEARREVQLTKRFGVGR